MRAHVPIYISCATSQHTLVQLLGKNQVVVPIGHVVNVIRDRVFRHPDFLSIGKCLISNRLDVLKRQMTVDVSSKDINLLTTGLVIQQGIEIVFPESQRLCTDNPNTRKLLAVEHPGIVLDQRLLFPRLIETAGIIHPPVGLVLDRHGININLMILHPLQIGIQPREELVVAVRTQLAMLVALVLSITALGRAVGLILTGR